MEPIEPIHPIEPIEPIYPIEPIEPIQPMEPIEPIHPMEPTEPTCSLRNKKRPTLSAYLEGRPAVAICLIAGYVELTSVTGTCSRAKLPKAEAWLGNA